MKEKAAIFLCDLTTIAAEPWAKKGVNCFCFDIQHPYELKKSNKENIYICGKPIGTKDFTEELLYILNEYEVVFACAFPPCTDLAVSGAAWFKTKRSQDKDFQYRAMRFFGLCENICMLTGAPYFIENPVSVISTMYRKPNESFHPHFYGGYLPENDKHPYYPEYIEPRDAYPKKTCLWTGNGFKMPITKPIDIKEGYSKQHSKLGGKSLKTKNIRSATPRGFSIAVCKANYEI